MGATLSPKTWGRVRLFIPSPRPSPNILGRDCGLSIAILSARFVFNIYNFFVTKRGFLPGRMAIAKQSENGVNLHLPLRPAEARGKGIGEPIFTRLLKQEGRKGSKKKKLVFYI